MIPSAHAIGITGGHCDDTGWAPGIHELSFRDGVADGVDEERLAVREDRREGGREVAEDQVLVPGEVLGQVFEAGRLHNLRIELGNGFGKAVEQGAAKGGLFDDGRQLSRLIGHPTTPMAETVRQALRPDPG